MNQIIVTNSRQKDGQNIPGKPTQEPADKAFHQLVHCEFGYGGYVVDLKPHRIEVVTHVMGCIDNTVMEGSVKDMEPFLKAAAIATICDKFRHENGISEAQMKNVMDITQGNPLVLSMGGGEMVLGMHKERAIYMAMLAEDSAESVEPFKGQDLNTLSTLVAMKEFEGASQADLLQLIN